MPKGTSNVLTLSTLFGSPLDTQDRFWLEEKQENQKKKLQKEEDWRNVYRNVELSRNDSYTQKEKGRQWIFRRAAVRFAVGSERTHRRGRI